MKWNLSSDETSLTGKKKLETTELKVSHSNFRCVDFVTAAQRPEAFFFLNHFMFLTSSIICDILPESLTH